MADKTQIVEMDGVITEVLPNASFKVKLNNIDKIIDARVSGKMRMHYIKINVSDKVKLQMTPYDLNRGRIVYRYK